MYDVRIILLKKEIDYNKNYINNSYNEKRIFKNKLEIRFDVWQKINQANSKIKIQNFNLIIKSLKSEVRIK